MNEERQREESCEDAFHGGFDEEQYTRSICICASNS
jgi:hypothetical protein